MNFMKCAILNKDNNVSLKKKNKNIYIFCSIFIFMLIFLIIYFKKKKKYDLVNQYDKYFDLDKNSNWEYTSWNERATTKEKRQSVYSLFENSYNTKGKPFQYKEKILPSDNPNIKYIEEKEINIDPNDNSKSLYKFVFAKDFNNNINECMQYMKTTPIPKGFVGWKLFINIYKTDLHFTSIYVNLVKKEDGNLYYTQFATNFFLNGDQFHNLGNQYIYAFALRTKTETLTWASQIRFPDLSEPFLLSDKIQSEMEYSFKDYDLQKYGINNCIWRYNINDSNLDVLFLGDINIENIAKDKIEPRIFNQITKLEKQGICCIFHQQYTSENCPSDCNLYKYNFKYYCFFENKNECNCKQEGCDNCSKLCQICMDDEKKDKLYVFNHSSNLTQFYGEIKNACIKCINTNVFYNIKQLQHQNN